MKRRKDAASESNAVQHRIALTHVYLEMACPDIDHSTRTKLADSILALIDDQNTAMPQKKITDAHAVISSKLPDV
jgi:hypothetical protein